MQQTGANNWLHYAQQPTNVPTRAPIGNIKVQNIITINAQSPNVVIESPSYNAKENVPPPQAISNAPMKPMHNIYKNAFDSNSYQFQPTQPSFANGRKRPGLHQTSTDQNGALKVNFDVDENNMPKSAKTSESLFSSATHFRPISGLGETSPPTNDSCSLTAAETPKRTKLSDKSFDTKREIAANFGCISECNAQKENVYPDVKTEVKNEAGLICGGVRYPKPPYSYSYLIILALKNSKNGYLPVTDIYTFVRRHYPYYETATDVWKNSIRHNLSLSKGFEKVARYNPEAPSSKKGCLWAMNPDKSPKVDEELSRYRSKDLQLILSSMRYPDKLDIIDSGCHGFGGVVDAFKSQYGMTNFGAYIRLYMREALLQEPCIQLDDDHWESVSLPENPVSVNGMYVSHPQVGQHPEPLPPPPPYTPGSIRPPTAFEAPIVIQQRSLPVLTKQSVFPSFPPSFIPQDYHRKDSNSYYHPQPIVLKPRNLNSISTSKGLAIDENGLAKANSHAVSSIANENFQNSFWSPPQLSSSVIRSSPFDDLAAHTSNGHHENSLSNFGLSHFINSNSGSHSNSPHIVNHSDASVAFLDSVAGLPVVPGCTPYGSPSLDFSSAVTPSNHHHLHESYHQLNSGSNDFLSPFSNPASVGTGHGDSNEYLNYGEHLFESLNSSCYTGQC